ncbi:hypothetical protein [Quadrisphaera sp. INWT6]|uniref:hypothetical protein n=1 Tax=Quadrisphaera sp. INWT6 TaxID=2596917 RepID=UPI001892131D|nr:hypothetical protein [Quadrisphaera sp. INWT6]MBF5083446.1 hypothetical protein [Quadrisphaera sp. INWT6]
MSSTGKPSRARLAVGAALLALALASLGGCAHGEGLGGGDLPHLSAEEHVDAESVPFQGVLHIGPQGCLMVRLTDPAGNTADRWTVWPTGAELVLSATQSGNGARVHGEVYADQERVTGSGRLVQLADLPSGDSPGSYFEGKGRYCDALVGGVLVIDDVQHA